MTTVNSLHILLACNATLLAAAVIALLRFQRMTIRNKVANTSDGVALDGRDDRDAVLCGFLDHRLSLMQARLDLLAVRPAPAKPDAPAASSSRAEGTMPFDYAVRIMQHGASIEDVMQACGLNRAEASLIKRIHGSAKSVESDAAA